MKCIIYALFATISLSALFFLSTPAFSREGRMLQSWDFSQIETFYTLKVDDDNSLNIEEANPAELQSYAVLSDEAGEGSQVIVLPVFQPVYDAIGELATGTVEYVVAGLIIPPEIFFKIFSGEEDLSYIAGVSMGNPLFDSLMIPVGRFVLIATGQESPSYIAEPTGFPVFDSLLMPVGIFFKVFSGEEDLSYIAGASMGNPLFDSLMIPVGRFVLIATGEENPSYIAEPTGFELFDSLLMPVGIFFRVFSGEEDLSYIAGASMGNPLFDSLMIPVGRFVLIATGEEDLTFIAEPTGFPLFDMLLVPVGTFFSISTGEEELPEFLREQF